MDNRADNSKPNNETDVALEVARKISNYWRSGKFRQDGGVVEGITPIVQEAIKAEMENARNWAIEAHNSAKKEHQLREQLKDAQDEAFGAYAEADALREQLAEERQKRESIESINKSLARAVDNPCR